MRTGRSSDTAVSALRHGYSNSKICRACAGVLFGDTDTEHIFLYLCRLIGKVQQTAVFAYKVIGVFLYRRGVRARKTAQSVALFVYGRNGKAVVKIFPARRAFISVIARI